MRRILIAIAGIGLLCHAAVAFAARPYQMEAADPVREPWRWRVVSELRGKGVGAFTEAPNGALWFGTESGAEVYDGLSWTQFTSEEIGVGAEINDLAATPDGAVWAGGRLGLARYVGGEWERVLPPRGQLPWPIAHLSRASDGGVWAAGPLGATHVGSRGVTLVTISKVGELLREADASIQIIEVPNEAAPSHGWPDGLGIHLADFEHRLRVRKPYPAVILDVALGSPAEAAGIRAGDRVERFGEGLDQLQNTLQAPPGRELSLRAYSRSTGQGSDSVLTAARIGGRYVCFQVHSIHEGPSGTLWLGMEHGAVLSVPWRDGAPAGPWKIDQHPPEPMLRPAMPHVLESRTGDLWVVTASGAMPSRVRMKGVWRTLTPRELGAMSTAAVSVLEDSSERIWIAGGAPRTGLSTYRDGKWTVYGEQDIPAFVTRASIHETADGSLWLIGNRQQVLRLSYHAAQWESFQGLAFQFESADGDEWFLSSDDGAVIFSGDARIRYGVEDGLMDSPARLFRTPDGEIWAIGSHRGHASTARLEGGRWIRETHPRLAWGVQWRAVYLTPEGEIWISAVNDPYTQRGEVGGLLRWDPNSDPPAWTHIEPPERESMTFGFGRDRHGVDWYASYWGMKVLRGEPRDMPPTAVANARIDALFGDRDSDLWIATRTLGLYRYDGSSWRAYTEADGLAENRVWRIAEGPDQSIWALTPDGVSRLVDEGWITDALPPDLPKRTWTDIQVGSNGALWLTRASESWLRRGEPSVLGEIDDKLLTVRYLPDTVAPETEILSSGSAPSTSGAMAIQWRGQDPWSLGSDGSLRYSYRLDEGDWSSFAETDEIVFDELAAGLHRIEVRAQDRDGNIDHSPASATFTVDPPFWQRPWVVALAVGLILAFAVQSKRLIQSQNELRRSNRLLSKSNLDLQAFTALVSERLLDPLREIQRFIRQRMGVAEHPPARADSVIYRRLERETGDLACLVADLLTYARLGEKALKIQRVSVGSLIGEVLGELTPELEGRSLDLDLRDTPDCDGDPVLLKQALYCVVRHALRELRGRPFQRIEAGGELNAAVPTYFIRYNGAEVSAEDLAVMFATFASDTADTAHDASLDLATARRLVERLGGKVWAKPLDGGGVTVFLTVNSTRVDQREAV